MFVTLDSVMPWQEIAAGVNSHESKVHELDKHATLVAHHLVVPLVIARN